MAAAIPRMAKEMADGQGALRSGGDARALIRANAGGPYGSKALAGVQRDSNAVWERVRTGGDAGASWLKASLAVVADETAPWAVVAGGERWSFGPPPR